MRWHLVFLVACTPKAIPQDDPPDPDPEPEDSTSSSSSSSSELGYLQVTQLYIDAEFGWDASLQQLVDVVAGGEVVPPALYLLLGTDTWRESGWDLAWTDEYCTMVLPLTSSIQATWAVQDPVVWFGVDYVDGLQGALTDCGSEGKQLDPAIFGEDPLATMVEAYGTWGVGLGEWGPSWYDTWLEAYPDDDLLDRYVGARVQNGGDMDADDFRAYPVQIDPVTYEAQDDGTSYLGVPPDQVPQGDTVTTAWYRISSLWVYGI
jgi:hypothetical protein